MSESIENRTWELISEFVDTSKPRNRTWGDDPTGPVVDDFFRWVVTENKDVTGLLTPNPENCNQAAKDGTPCVLEGGNVLGINCPYCLIIQFKQNRPEDVGVPANEIVYAVLEHVGFDDPTEIIRRFYETELSRDKHEKHERILDLVKNYDAEIKNGKRKDLPIPRYGRWAKMSAKQRYTAMEETYDEFRKEKGFLEIV